MDEYGKELEGREKGKFSRRFCKRHLEYGLIHKMSQDEGGTGEDEEQGGEKGNKEKEGE